MDLDIRKAAARYYDLSPNTPSDVPFYINRLRSPESRVLELGCGTGRVSIPLAKRCSFLYGIDRSEAMLALCREKLGSSGLPRDRIVVETADITDFALDTSFDLIIAPGRVIQNLESDEQLEGLFRGIRTHLASKGRCILNVFNPNRPRDVLLRDWVCDVEHLDWDVQDGTQRVTCHHVRRRLQEDPLIVYPDLIYRRYEGGRLVDEAVLSIPMRCYYPAEFLELISSHGFTVLDTWGGYAGEAYGAKGELIVEFAAPH